MKSADCVTPAVTSPANVFNSTCSDVSPYVADCSTEGLFINSQQVNQIVQMAFVSPKMLFSLLTARTGDPAKSCKTS